MLFNGQYIANGQAIRAEQPTRFPTVWLNNREDDATINLAEGLVGPAAGAQQQVPAQQQAAAQQQPQQLRPSARAAPPPVAQVANVGPLGMLRGAANSVPRYLPLTGEDLVIAVAEAVTTLESNGYGPPFVCVLGQAAFIAAIVGGFNQVRGAIAGGLLIGVVDNLSAAYVSTQYRAAVPLILLIVIILFRPQGLLGRPEERTV